MIEYFATGMTRAEVAVLTGLSPDTVKKYLQRARRRALKKMTAAEGASARSAAQQRYARALNPAKPPRFRPFTLLNGEA